MYILHARYITDVDRDEDGIEIDYVKFVPGTGNKKIKKWLYTRPLGDWTSLSFNESEYVDLVDFIMTMTDVNSSLDTQRLIASLCAQEHNMRVKPNYYNPYIKTLNAIKILDPTFEPPIINLKCRWQRELIHSLCNEWTEHVIWTCMNSSRLYNYVNALRYA